MATPSTTRSDGSWASTTSPVSEHNSAPRLGSPANSRHRSVVSPSAEIRAHAKARSGTRSSQRVSSPLNTGSSSRYSSHSGSASRAGASTRHGASSPGITGSSSQYPSTLTSTNDRPDTTGSTWPAPRTASVLLDAPPRYQSVAGSEVGGDHATLGETDNRDPRIVLALDYGTTFSGIAWMQDDGDTRNSIDDLLVLDEFPPNAPRQQWGFDIDETSTVLRWTKSRLKLQKPKDELNALKDLVEGLLSVDDKRLGKGRVYDRQTPEHLSKSPADVVKSYLWRLAMCWRDVMISRGRHMLDEVPLEIVITHPAFWPYEVQNATYQAAIAAFPKTHFETLRGISFSPEPESCALYTIQELLAQGGVRFMIGECFIICDAGGGTIDLGSYRIDRLNPLKLTKVGILTGDDFGATLVDQAFLEWLNNKIPELDLSPRTYLKNVVA